MRRGVRRVSSPVSAGSPERVVISYVRRGPHRQTPAVVLPGGPGIASILPYRGFRTAAAKAGLDVIMLDHRGLGFSNHTTSGRRLRADDIWLAEAADDIAAVLDDAGVAQAVIAGVSYGSYLAQVFAVRHPDRVAALVLDSPLFSVRNDLAMAQEHRRDVLWRGQAPNTARAADLAHELARREDPRELAQVAGVVFESGGSDLLERMLLARRRGHKRWLWRLIAGLNLGELENPTIPYFSDARSMANIGFAELGFGLYGDGGPMDLQEIIGHARNRHPDFVGEPYDLTREVKNYRWPTIVLSGELDLRTPPPVAHRIADEAPAGILIAMPETGHGVLSSSEDAFIEVLRLTCSGQSGRLESSAPQLAAMPAKGLARLPETLLRAALR